MPVNYQLGKIYRIHCNVTNKDYYGSSAEPTLARRLAGHRMVHTKLYCVKTTHVTQGMNLEPVKRIIFRIMNV
eukprot:gene307-329_t